MLRVIRLIGIVVFALLVGVSANSLKEMHVNGELMDQYNPRRKANITLVSSSALAVAALGWFELTSLRRLASRRRFGSRRYTNQRERETDGLDSTSIYSTPKTVDEWKTRRSSRPRHRPRPAPMEEAGDRASVWHSLARLCAVIIPIVYLTMLIIKLRAYDAAVEAAWLIPTGLGALSLFSLIVAVGILLTRTWGLSCGYVLAICNLMVFPYGTALGLFLLIGLVGSSSEFVLSERNKRKAKRRGGQKRASVPAY